MKIRDLVVEFVPIASIRQRPRRARIHSKRQIAQIARSIEVFNWVNPIIVDRQSVIVAGDGRLAAAKELGIESVPVIRIEDMSEAQVRAYILADNKLAENAGWDKEVLQLELQELIEIERDFEITVTGFEMAELDVHLSGAPDEEEPDWPPPSNAYRAPICKVGDLWHWGPHRLMCADATDSSAFEQLMGGERAEMVFCDPPYNVPVKAISGRGSHKHPEFAMASGEMSEAEFVRFLKTSLGLMASHSIDGAVHFVCMDWRHSVDLLTAARDIYDAHLNTCVWIKPNGGMGSLYRSQYECVHVFKHGTAAHINNVELGRHGRNRTNVWSYEAMNSFGRGREQALAAHPTVKPVAMVRDAILDCSNRSGIILDAFAGSGTTLLAAHRTGRRGYGIEIDPAYVDVALRRLTYLTGIEPVHSATGKTFNDLELEHALMRRHFNHLRGEN